MTLTIRNVDKITWQRFRTTATRSKLAVGIALNRALNTWIETQEREKKKVYGLEIKPIKIPHAPRDLSKNIDKYLYGE